MRFEDDFLRKIIKKKKKKYNSGNAVFCQEFSEKFNLTESG